MPVLAYCIAESAAPVLIGRTGVGGIVVENFEAEGLRCYIARGSRESMLGSPAREAALAFHRVLQEIFARAAIIPFRFPTLAADDAEMAAHLREHAAEYQQSLTRLRGLVQMEVNINFAAEVPPSQSGSGTSYLKTRQEARAGPESLAKRFREAGAALIRDWRQRTTAHGLRCFALIERAQIADFRQSLRPVKLPPELTARVSGPWPATDFLEER